MAFRTWTADQEGLTSEQFLAARAQRDRILRSVVRRSVRLLPTVPSVRLVSASPPKRLLP